MVKAIKRDTLKEKAFNELDNDKNNEGTKATLERALNAITKIKVDTNDQGKECVLTLMGMNIYTWNNEVFTEVVKNCLDDADVFTSAESIPADEKHNYIIELDKDIKK